MAKITTSYQGDRLFVSQLGNHSVMIDVPAGMGGKDRGVTPPELFVASLGSCVGAFVAQYCERVGVDASGMTVDVLFRKVEDPVRLVDLEIRVYLPNGDCSGREKSILRVAERCPVHETILTVEGIDIQIFGKGQTE